MFARSDDPYLGADPETSRRAGAALLGFSVLLTLLFFPLDPPTDPIGSAGWAPAAVLAALGAAGVFALIRRRAGFDTLLASAYLCAAGIAVLVWLAGGVSADYEDLYLFAVAAGLIHPPRRAFPLLGFVVVCLALPLFYNGTGGGAETKVIAEAMLLVAIAGVLAPFLFHIRRQRTQLERGVEVARRLAKVDSLTGLANRRAFDESLTVEIARAEREGEPMSVGLIDLDGLKQINDRHGHLEGDRVLEHVARVLERAVRASDRCFRWGGDEFAVLLPETNRGTGNDVLARVAEQISSECRDIEGDPLDVSFGVAELDHGGSAEDFLALADLALLEQKTDKRRG
jgi:diguanylate cyclase (GGDEF)-like protein